MVPSGRADDLHGAREPKYSINILIQSLREIAPRDTGNGWCIIKLHDLRHICLHISKFGAPANWDSCTGERHLKEYAKKPARTAQMRGYKTFLKQTMKRTVERSALAVARDDWRIGRWKEWSDGDLSTINEVNSACQDRRSTIKNIVQQRPDGSFDTMSIMIFRVTWFVHTATRQIRQGQSASVGRTNTAPPQAILDAVIDHATSQLIAQYPHVRTTSLR